MTAFLQLELVLNDTAFLEDPNAKRVGGQRSLTEMRPAKQAMMRIPNQGDSRIFGEGVKMVQL